MRQIWWHEFRPFFYTVQHFNLSQFPWWDFWILLLWLLWILKIIIIEIKLRINMQPNWIDVIVISLLFFYFTALENLFNSDNVKLSGSSMRCMGFAIEYTFLATSEEELFELIQLIKQETSNLDQNLTSQKRKITIIGSYKHKYYTDASWSVRHWIGWNHEKLIRDIKWRKFQNAQLTYNDSNKR